ncbi:LacI family transcriptional regulator [Subtercola boreus]|uniref:LacI family transcriptional regulator n=1 Tax=Subtercola boreus TaxID=120213 RepID=A0A3E0VLG9_9MICO|nr:LacI family DNA-binding transcriptional regulator [Subtercola boreus]RFA10270.1 LacI family transcriptional regulator [Subtercola boreus]TQL52548.1 LacI family transcriptional regulator [Subtercola boreus]
MGKTTLKDVGDYVGVSAKTVSNVVNNTGWVGDELKERVHRAIVELGYRPNAAARQLRSGRSGMIALALPDLAQPYFAELASAVVRAAAARSITVLINQTNGDFEAERRIADGVGIPVMDGVILSALALTARDLTHREDSMPIVLLGEHIGESAFPHVAVDSAKAAEAATNHLLASGRRRIAAIGAQSDAPRETADLRLAGYRAALAGAGITPDPTLVAFVNEFQRADGVAAMKGLLANGADFDAVFAFNDLLALGAMHTLISRGIRVPEDVAVIGFDDIEEGRFATPPLTSISPDKDAIAHAALDLLLDAGKPDPTRTVAAQSLETTIPFQIAKRASA